MEVHFSDLIFLFLQQRDPDYFNLTESPGGIKVMEWVYATDKMLIAIFSADNQLIAWHVE